MEADLPEHALQLVSTVKGDATLELALREVEVPRPGPGEVLVRIEAAPVNPSDLGLLLGGADVTTAREGGTSDRPTLTADIPPGAMRALAARLDQALPVGNEGAGTVVAAGQEPGAQALLGRTVAILGGATYSQYRCLPAPLCMALPEGTTAAEGASCFVNPLTALGMVETMRREGHSGLVHTAAASNLGQMLHRLCIEDGIPLVNIVRRPEQVELLEKAGARWVCNSGAEDFEARLTDALEATGATLAFDATGGGDLAGRILTCMEAAAMRGTEGYSRYGSTVHKQIYLYGSLDPSPTRLERRFGMAWGLGGWLLPIFLQRIGGEATQRLRERVVAEIRTTFASHYSAEISLTDMLRREVLLDYARQATGRKVLVRPQAATHHA